ncbi:nucleoside triphosphate pyrophosphatase [Cellulomonas sp. HZM]|uniref:Maf family protein n=1 Tax=Cellulomonas sp. HZM TaxID=1454010 RepID=UPI000492FA7C|nr:nucleoside triphosphate pyrophosphatase [Cellulomonas sp. HZM]
MTRLLLASASPARRATLVAAGIDPLVAVSSVDEPAVLAAARDRYDVLEPADAVLVLAQAKAQDVAENLPDEVDGLVLDDLDLVLVGCDSMLELNGEILGKPADADDAIARWRVMRGRTGVLHTGHWVMDLREPAHVTGTADREGGAGSGGATSTTSTTSGAGTTSAAGAVGVASAGGPDLDHGGIGHGGIGLGARRGAVLGATSSTRVTFADLSDDEIAAYVGTGEPLHVAGAFTVDGLGGPFVERIEGDHHGVVGISLPLLRELLAEIDVRMHDLWR